MAEPEPLSAREIALRILSYPLDHDPDAPLDWPRAIKRRQKDVYSFHHSLKGYLEAARIGDAPDPDDTSAFATLLHSTKDIKSLHKTLLDIANNRDPGEDAVKSLLRRSAHILSLMISSSQEWAKWNRWDEEIEDALPGNPGDPPIFLSWEDEQWLERQRDITRNQYESEIRQADNLKRHVTPMFDDLLEALKRERGTGGPGVRGR